MVENRPATVSSTEKNERLVKERLILVVILGYRSSLVSWILHDIMHNYKWVKNKKKVVLFSFFNEWKNDVILIFVQSLLKHQSALVLEKWKTSDMLL